MIDERMEEQASLYVLGALAPEEQLAFQATLDQNAELQQLVDKLQVSRDALAGTVPMVEPSQQLKHKILAQIAPPEKNLVRPPRSEPFSFLK